MKRKIFHFPFIFLLFFLFSYSFVNPKKNTETQVIKSLESVQGKNPNLEMNPEFGSIPLYFIPNEGQVNEKALFYAKTSRYTLWMTREGLVFDSSRKLESNFKGNKGKEELDSSKMSRKDVQPEAFERDVSRLIFQNANKNPEIVPLELTEYRVNYFIGKNKSKWKTDISTSKRVLYKDLYKNIDLKVYGVEEQIEYDWIVKPEGNPEEIIFTYKDTDGTEINNEGDLLVLTEFGELVHKKPISYQVVGGARVDVESSFKCIEKDTYGFKLGVYDKNYELIIDPVVLVYSTYLGGSFPDYGRSIVVDSSGHAYVTGYTYSTDFPTQNPFQSDQNFEDVFVTKLSPAGSSLVYSTYLGGGSNDRGDGIAVDSSGNAYVTGYTKSTDFPTQNPFQTDQGNQDVFVTKLSAAGSSLVYSTYLGGSNLDRGNDIAVDSSGKAYVTGYTESTDFPTQNPYQTDQGLIDVFVTKLSSAGSSLVYSTYLGGGGSEIGYGIVVDGSGNAYVTGYTHSTDFPTQNPFQTDQEGADVFVTKLSSAGNSLVYSTYLGGGGSEIGYGIVVDVSGNAYVTGETPSTDFPTQNPFQTHQGGTDVFVTKLSSTGSSLVYSTYLGGSLHDGGYGIAVDSSGYAYVTGYTYSYNLPLKNWFQEPQLNMVYKNAFVTKFSYAGNSLVSSTHLGDYHEDQGNGIAVDSSGNAYVTGYTESTDFPTQNPYQTDQNFEDAFVTKLPYQGSSPDVTTTAVTNITQTSSASGGNVTRDGGEDVTARGVCWSMSANPTTGDSKTSDGTGTGSFSSSITGLSPEQASYHVRAYATNSIGTSYGEDREFTTTSLAASTVTTTAASSITATSASSGGNVTANGGASVTARGVCWSTSANPTTADSKTSDGTGTGSFTSSITGLLPNTTYHVRAYSTNSVGTSYGSDKTFSTEAAAPNATTDAASSLGANAGTLNGTVNANNESTTVTFEYGLTTSYGTTVTAAQSPVTGSSDTAVSKAISGLTANMTYHYRVVGQNATGTSNGSDMTFTTNATAPTVTTNTASSLGANAALLNGTVNANNESTTVTFEYGTTTAYGTTVTADQSPVSGASNTAVSKSITSLVPNTTYHYRVAGQNATGTSNGSDVTFTTNATAPTVTTNTASSLGANAATLNGTVNANNESTTVTFEYGLDTSYGMTVTADQSPVTGSSDTTVSKAVSGLTPNTTYHYRVVGQNATGTTNGADTTFTTNAAAPTATTNSASSLGTSGATLNGTVNANNDSTTVTFEYGSTTAYGTTVTADQSPVTGASNTAVSKSITSLVPNTLYHYRVVGQNVTGTTNGADTTFTTSKSAPTVTTDAATSVGITGATLNGTVNANNESTTVTFEYGLTTSYGTKVTADQSPVTGAANTAVSKTITSLIPNTTYHYRAVGQNTTGTTNGADSTFATNAAAPQAQTDAASSVGITGATLNGTVNANNESTTVSFEYGTTTAYGTTVTADQSPVTGSSDTAVSKAISGQTPNTTYHYRVVGQNVTGTTNGADMTFTTESTVPTVTTTSVSDITSNSAQSGGSVTDNGGESVTERGVCWSMSANPTTGDSKTSDGTDTGSFTSSITGLLPGTTYYVRAYATNTEGTSYGDEASFTTVNNPIIYGNVSDPDGSGIEGVILTFLNNDSITSTDSNGNYSNTAIYGWSGTVNPQKAGYVFEPENRSYSNVIEDQTGGNFTGYPPPSVSITSPIFGSILIGTVPIEADAFSVSGISKVEFYIGNSKKGEDTVLPYQYSWNTTADSDGAFEIKVIAYNEKGQTGSDQINVRVNNNEAENPVISGHVRDSGNNGIAGVTVTFVGSGGVSTTDENGFYLREVLYGWSGTVTLSKPAFRFDPAIRSYAGVLSNQDNQDYLGESLPIVEISGDISEDMVWSSDFYYVVTGDINIPEGVSLTLEPGTVVAFQEGSTMTIEGELTALGTEEEPIVLMPESGNFEGLNFYGEVISLSYCVISNVTGSINIGKPDSNISSTDYRAAGNTRLIQVDHCTFINNFNGIIITGSDSIIFENNIVMDAEYGFEINLSGSQSGTESVVIKNNIFTQIKDTVLEIDIVPSSYEISGNSFFNNGICDVDFLCGVTDRLDMRNNYWGTKNAEDIPYRIYDNDDDPTRGTVEFEPFLTEPFPDAPAQISSVDVSPTGPLPLGLATFKIRFNRRMDILQEPWVSFGRYEPYEDYTIEGFWEDEWTWSGIYGVTGTTEAGVHTIKVSRAKGTDEMEVTNEYSHKFEISKSVVLTLEASRKEERALIVTKEYGDIEFRVEKYADVQIERYVIYRKSQGGVYSVLRTIQESEIVNGQYSFYDKYLMKDVQYTYKMVAVNSKGVTVGNSNEKII